jgi:hypothetical protein
MRTERLLLPVLLCATAAAADPHRYALVIGVTGYPNFHTDERLQYADADAKLFAGFLESEAAGHFPHENVRLLLNGEATRTNIYKEIAWIGSRSDTDDIVYVYFAGHGVVDNSGRAYFMPYDGDPNVPVAQGIRADEFVRSLREQISARQQIFFVDACHAGAVYSPDGATRRDVGNVVPALTGLWRAAAANAAEVNMAFLSAASNQFSLEDDTYRQGVFTYYLVEGLRGKADLDHNGQVTAGELRNYLQDSVMEYARRKSSQQTPTVSPVFEPGVVLSIYESGRPRSPVQQTGPLPAPIPGKLDLSRTPNPRLTLKADAREVGPKRYEFHIWLDIAANDRSRISKAVYDFVLTTNPLHIESSNAADGFAVSYEGYGCYTNVQVAVTLSNGLTLAPEKFDMCSAMGAK